MSRVNFGAKPVMYPMPVLIIATYDENGVPDAMNAAWGVSCIIKIPIIADGSPQSCRGNFPIIAEPCLVFS